MFEADDIIVEEFDDTDAYIAETIAALKAVTADIIQESLAMQKTLQEFYDYLMESDKRKEK